MQCPSIVYGTSAAGLARRARASEAHVLGLVPRESERSGAKARYTRKPPRAVRGRLARGSTGLAPQEQRPVARAVPFQRAWTECPRLGAARARVGSAHAGPRPQRERAQLRARALRTQDTSRYERQGWHAGARAWRRWNGGLSLAQCPSIVHGPSAAGLARRARVGSERAGPRPQRERAQWCASALHAQATTRSEREGWHVEARAWRRRNGGLSLVRCPSIVYGSSAAGLARRARASEAHVLGLVPRKSERSGAQAWYTRKPPRAVRGRAGTWKHGHGADGTAASRSCSALLKCMNRVAPAWRDARTRRKRTCWASSPERASAVARKRATRASHHAQ